MPPMFGSCLATCHVGPRCTGAFWDAVLLGKRGEASLGVDEDLIAKLRREVTFWTDSHRSSGKYGKCGKYGK